MTDAPSRPEPPKSPIELPMASWVKGGTTSMRHDQQEAAARADAERRRALDDAHQRIVQANPNEAHLKSMKLGSLRNNPMVVLRCEEVEEFRGRPMECELLQVATPDGKEFELALQMVCLKCLHNGRSQAQAQMIIRQSNRWFDLDTRRAGELWVDPDDGEPYHIAGTITTRDWVTCSALGCGWRFRIDNSMIRVR